MINGEDGADGRSVDDPVPVDDTVPVNVPVDAAAAAAAMMYTPRSSVNLNLHPPEPVCPGKNAVDSWKLWKCCGKTTVW